MEYTYGLGTLDAADKQTQGTDWVLKSVLEFSEQEYEQCVGDCVALDTQSRRPTLSGRSVE